MRLFIHFQGRKAQQPLGIGCLKSGQSCKDVVDKFLDKAGQRNYFYRQVMLAAGKHCGRERGLKTAWAQAVQWVWILGVRNAMYGNLVVVENVRSLKR
ncbi:MAG: hypothetical protein JWR26_2288 [Pedosphaera sp.]|nr:hypothetical protein [Pedosphaera sp.]